MEELLGPAAEDLPMRVYGVVHVKVRGRDVWMDGAFD